MPVARGAEVESAGKRRLNQSLGVKDGVEDGFPMGYGQQRRMTLVVRFSASHDGLMVRAREGEEVREVDQWSLSLQAKLFSEGCTFWQTCPERFSRCCRLGEGRIT